MYTAACEMLTTFAHAHSDGATRELGNASVALRQVKRKGGILRHAAGPRSRHPAGAVAGSILASSQRGRAFGSQSAPSPGTEAVASHSYGLIPNHVPDLVHVLRL